MGTDLENSLLSRACSAIGLTGLQDFSTAPSMVLKRLNHPDMPISSSPDFLSNFERLGSKFLIVGPPGSGKTTILLQLARQFHVVAEGNPDAPVPVLLSLSSWG